MLDDIIELVLEVVLEILGDSAFYKFVRRRRSPLARFLMGLTTAALIGIACWCVVTLVRGL